MFRVAARTLLQLGAELISSDAVAFFELLKNAFDAGSPRVEVDVVVRLPSAASLADRALNPPVDVPEQDQLKKLRSLALSGIDMSAPSAKDLAASVEASGSLSDLARHLDAANYIDVTDFGAGMTLERLTDVFLTVGTRARILDRKALMLTTSASSKQTRPILGEKGLGRLSAINVAACSPFSGRNAPQVRSRTSDVLEI